MLNPEIDFLNHGSFGATPKVVLETQRHFADALESDPIEFLAPERRLLPKLDAVRNRLAGLVNTPPDSLAFVRNATDGVNAVVRSIVLDPGDEVVITNHGYNACNNAVRFAAERQGATVRVAEVPFPLRDAGEVVEAIERVFSNRTRLLVVDHVTSPTGLVFPIDRIIAACKQRGIRTLVDGAHAPGMMEIDLNELAPDYYTGNHHKWLCAPKTSGFLYVRTEYHDEVRPTVISHGANTVWPGRSKFQSEFDWVGTYDPTPLLAVPAALDFLESLHVGGIIGHMLSNHQLALAARAILLDRLAIEAPSPESMIGSMVTIPLPQHIVDSFAACESLQQWLYKEHKIELPIFRGSRDRWLLRVSLQAYNTIEQIERLVRVMQTIGIHRRSCSA
ncbi:Isopenicillin N epimerase [Stieleria varia]|uniref:Isopenicillin N epimerase n=2 Tax=Stieleria varia TaxID=2528005 RepID=A0A5C6BA35_9BACT|nr:Isopenicillin N epimerase [Stieleria varia]